MTHFEFSQGKTQIHTKLMTPEVMIDAYMTPYNNMGHSSKGSVG